MMVVSMHLCASPGLGAGSKNVEGEEELPWELDVHGAIATGNITKRKEFWRTFIRNPGVMNWIEEGYRLLRTVSPPPRGELANIPPALEHRKFVSGAVAKMQAANAMTLLPLGAKPWVVSPLGVVTKARAGKFRLTVNMRFDNRHLGDKAFMFEGPSGPGGEGRLRGVLRHDVGVPPHRSLPRVARICRLQVGRQVLRVKLPFLWALDGPLGLFEGDA